MFPHLMLSLLIALLLAALFVPVFGWRRNGSAGGDMAFFFVLVFALTLAGGLWVTPYGPTLWGAPWLSLLLFGTFMALLIGAVTSPPPPRSGQLVAGPEDDPRVAETRLLNGYFWVLLLGALALVLIANI